MSTVNVGASLTEAAQRHPDRAALHQWEPSLLGGDYRHLDYGTLDGDSDDIARGLTAIGIGRGVRAALMVPPGRDFFALAFGMAKAGVVPVLVDPGMGLRGLRACLAEAAPEAFIGVPRAHLARMLLGWAEASVRHVVTVGGLGVYGGHTLEEVRALGRSSSARALADTRADEVAAILFTSGSTGPPKGVVYTQANFAAQIESLRRISDLGSDEVDLATFPPFALFDPALGMTTVVPRMDFSRPAAADPARLFATIERFGVTNMFCSPALLRVLAAWGAPRGLALPSVRRVISAGATVPADVIERFVAMLSPGARVLTPYGATEALPVSLIGSDELRGDARTGEGVCVGLPVEGVDVAIIATSDEPIERWSDSLRLPRDTVGEIVARGDVVTAAYDHRPADTALAKIHDGVRVWHRMGDLGYLDGLGRLWFCGRKAERVETGGHTLTSVPCEAVFDRHPAVRRSALVGVRGRDGVRPVMCVELEAHGPAVPRLQTELRALAIAHAHTARIDTFLVHPGFPVDTRHNAKIRRGELAVWAARVLR